MLELTDVPYINGFIVKQSEIPSGICRWFKDQRGADNSWSIYYKSNKSDYYEADRPDLLIEAVGKFDMPSNVNFYVGHQLAALLDLPVRGYINYLDTLLWSVSKDRFINAMTESNHCCLDWLLFNQDVWNK